MHTSSERREVTGRDFHAFHFEYRRDDAFMGGSIASDCVRNFHATLPKVSHHRLAQLLERKLLFFFLSFILSQFVLFISGAQKCDHRVGWRMNETRFSGIF